MENAFDSSAFYEKWESFSKSKQGDKEFEKIIVEPELSLSDFSMLLCLEMANIENKYFDWNDLVAQASLIYSKKEWKVFCHDIIEEYSYMLGENDAYNEKGVKMMLREITELYQLNPNIERLLSNFGFQSPEKVIKIISSNDTRKKKCKLLLEELNGIETTNYKQFNIILIFIIRALTKRRSGRKESDFDKLDFENRLMYGLSIFRFFSLFIRENYSEYLRWKNQYLLGNSIKYTWVKVITRVINSFTKKGWIMKYLPAFYNIIENGKNYINSSFDMIHSVLFTDKRKGAMVEFLSKDRYASYVQGLYNDYCEQNNIPLASRFYFSDRVKAFLPDIVNNQTGNIKAEIESKGKNIVTIDVSCYRLKKPKNFNVAELGTLYDKMSSFMTGGRLNFVFLFGGEIGDFNCKPINWSGTAEELIFFIRLLYPKKREPQWSKIVHIFHHNEEEYELTTLSNGNGAENPHIIEAIKNCKPDKNITNT